MAGGLVGFVIGGRGQGVDAGDAQREQIVSQRHRPRIGGQAVAHHERKQEVAQPVGQRIERRPLLEPVGRHRVEPRHDHERDRGHEVFRCCACSTRRESRAASSPRRLERRTAALRPRRPRPKSPAAASETAVRFVIVDVVQPAADEIHRKREQQHLRDRDRTQLGVRSMQSQRVHQRQHGPDDGPTDLDQKQQLACR